MTSELLITFVGLGCSVAGVAVGIGANKLTIKKDAKECNDENKIEGQEKGVLLTEIGYIKAGVDDIKRKQDNQEGKHNDLAERVTRVEESAKQAHLRIDRCEESK